MKTSPEAPARDGNLAFYSRRRFLKGALLAAAYATPLIVSYPRTVFASHCAEDQCGGDDHVFTDAMGMTTTWSPGCSKLK